MTQTVYKKYSSLFKIRIKCWADGRENGDGKDLFPLTGCGSIYNWFCSSNILGLVLFSFDFSFSCVYSGPAGPQGQLRGPYPGSSPPGQQMRGPMMANNSGPTGGQQPRPPYFAAGGGPTSNQGPAIRGPAGIQQSPFVYFCVCLVSASNCVLVVMSLVRVDSVKKSKKEARRWNP